MTLKSKLLHGSGPEWESNTTDRVCADFEQFKRLMDYFHSENSRLSHRATLINASNALNPVKPQLR